MNLIDFKNLGINEDTLVIHVDNYVTHAGKDLNSLCGLSQGKGRQWPFNYNMFEKKHLRNQNKICKKCQNIARRNDYDLISTIIHFKLTS